ncbi:restriction endonuclease [Micromonospora sp. NPDC002296]|uniref:restriction endonuclease n=1 Tax=Micromonospora sp. NPDC002296 TaxID=3154271 RepID=UPI00332E1067
MGRFGITRSQLREELADLVGVRVGLAVGIEELDPLINKELPDLGPNPLDGHHMRSAELNSVAFEALSKFGDPWTEFGPYPRAEAWRRLGKDAAIFIGMRDEIHSQAHLNEANTGNWRHPYDPIRCRSSKQSDPYASVDLFLHYADLTKIDRAALEKRVTSRFGDYGSTACRILLAAIEAEQRLDYWGRISRQSTSALVELSSLFDGGQWSNEKSDALDQRLVNYLGANLDDVTRIHWRQFEKLAATFFLHQGMHVELGPGSNDDGVDLRIWPSAEALDQPPLIIAQCKRQRQKVSKVVIKALWADMCAEKAERGLIVTSSTISPGAARTISARGYGIDIADGAAIRRWIQELRTPGTGITAA